MALAGGDRLIWGDGDPAMHVAIGREILSRGEIPATDPFLVGAPAFSDHEWAFDAGAAAVWDGMGPSGLVLVVAGVFLATAVELARQLRARASPFPATIALLLALACGPMHLQARPHVFTWAFLVFGRGMIDRGAPLPAWIALGAVWANLHGGFLPAIALLGLLGGWRPALGIALGSLLNPAGPWLHADIVAFLGNREVLSRTADFLPALPGVAGFETFLFLAAEILGAVALASWGRRDRRALLDAAWAGILVVLAASTVRNVPLVALLVAPDVARWLAAFLDGRSDEVRAAVASVEARLARLAPLAPAAVVAAAAALAFRLPGAPDVPRGLAALPPDRVVFATFHWGAWIALERPGIAVVTHPLTANYADAGTRMNEYLVVAGAGTGWREALAARGVGAAWLDPALPLVAALEADGWAIVQRTERDVVLVAP